MQPRRNILINVLGICVLCVFSVHSLQAQMPDTRPAGSINFRRMYFQYPITPKFQSVSFPQATDTREWFQMILQYELDGGQNGWFDEITLEWAVLVFTEQSPRRPFLLRRSVTYLDVAKGRHIAAMYIRPNFMLRYYGGRRIPSRDIAVRVELRVNGMKTGEAYLDGDRVRGTLPPNWWQLEEPHVFSKNFELLNRLETPFRDLNFDSYEFIKIEK